MDQETRDRLDALEKKIDAIYKSVERTRAYIKWSLIGGILTVVLPLIGLAIIIPFYISILQSSGGDLTGVSGLLK